MGRGGYVPEGMQAVQAISSISSSGGVRVVFT